MVSSFATAFLCFSGLFFGVSGFVKVGVFSYEDHEVLAEKGIVIVTDMCQRIDRDICISYSTAAKSGSHSVNN